MMTQFEVRQAVARRRRRVAVARLKKNLIWAAVLVGFMTILYLSQAKRLAAYDKWYMCMYDGWNYQRCDQLVYGKN